MRRPTWSFLPALLLTMLLWPSASVGEGVPYAEDTVLSVVTLTESQRALAAYLYQPILEGESRIDLPENTRYDDVGPAMRSLMQDRPELFHLGRTYNVGYVQHAPDVARYVSPEYRMDVAQAQLLRGELYAIARDLAARYPTAVDVHDALIARVTYGGDSELRHTAVGALLDGKATCEGYAQAMSLLYRMLGIPCGIVTGVARDASGVPQPHSWCIADMGGGALIDPTWNDQAQVGLNTRWYFGLSTAQMAADHTPDAGQSIPHCGEQANWHRAYGLVVRDRAEVYEALRRLVQFGGEMNLRFADAALYAEFAGDTFAFLGRYNEDVPQEDGFYGGYSLVCSDAQMCVVLRRVE